MRNLNTWIIVALAFVIVSCGNGESNAESTTTTSPETTSTEAAASTADSDIASWCEIEQESYEFDMEDPAAMEAAMIQTLAFDLARAEAAPDEIAGSAQVIAENRATFLEVLEEAGWSLDQMPVGPIYTPEQEQAGMAADDQLVAFELEHCGRDSREQGPLGG